MTSSRKVSSGTSSNTPIIFSSSQQVQFTSYPSRFIKHQNRANIFLHMLRVGGACMQSIPLWSPGDAAKLARDLKKDLGHLRRRGVDPATFLGGALVRIASRVNMLAR